MSRLSRGQYLLGVVAVLTVATTLRMGPLFWSPLPFNPDGIVYAGLVRETVASGTLPIKGLPVDSFLFTAFLTVLELVTDVPARYVSQPVLAVVGALSCLVAVAFGHRVAGVLGWVPHRRRQAGLLAGALLAVDGIYLHRSMAVDEQTVGLLFVPLIAFVLARAVATGRHRWGAVGGVMLVALPPLHNLESLLTLLLLALAVLVRRLTVRRITLGGGVLLAYLAYFLAYTWVLPVVTPAIAHQSARISYAPGLLLAWLIVVTLGLLTISRLRARTQRLLLGTALLSVFVLLVINSVRPVFPGSQTSPGLLIVLSGPLFVPGLVGVWTVPGVDRESPEWIAMLSLIGASFVLLGLSFTATLTLEYLNTAYRTSTFVHLPVLVFGAVGVLIGVTRLRQSIDSPTLRTSAATAVIVAMLCCAAVSIPIAFSGLEVLSYKGTTTPAEFSAATFMTTHVPDTWAADDHIMRTSRYFTPREDLWNISSGHVQPVYEWIKADGPPPDCPTVTQASWTDTGAQFYPRAPAAIEQSRLNDWQRTHNVIYRSSGPDPIVVGTPPGNATC